MINFQPFETHTVKRNAIQFDSDNPRQIDSSAEKKLFANLDRIGLLEPIIVNRKTGKVISGHQRLKWLDKKHGDDKYYDLLIAYCDLSEKEAQAQMIFMNNASAMGQWDLEKLERQLLEFADIDMTGFDRLDVEMLFPDNIELGKLFAGEPPQEINANLEEMRRMRKAGNEAKASKDDTEHYLIVVFADRKEKINCLRSFGLPDDERYLSYQRLKSNLGPLPSATRRAPRNQGNDKRKRGAAPVKKSGATG
jgi:hypothetical protein